MMNRIRQRIRQRIRLASLVPLTLLFVANGCQDEPNSTASTAKTATAGHGIAAPLAARIDGEPIPLEEIERSAGWRLHRARLDVHLILERETERLIDERLLEQHASERGIAVAALLEEVASDVAPVTDPEIDQYLAEHPTDASIDAARPRIRHYLEERRRIERRLALIDRLRDEAQIETYLEAPTRPRIELDLDGAPTRGQSDAPITVVQFADLSRDESARSTRELSQLERAFPGRLRIVHRSLPRERDEIGLLTAQLAAAAAQQDRFWALRDQLTQTSGVRERTELEAIATSLNIDVSVSHLGGDRKTLSAVQRDLKVAHRAGVRRAPTLFVNGRYFMGLDGYEALRALVLEELDDVDRAD